MQAKKILFATIPYDGHFNPLTGLAVYLKNIGYVVRWYTGSIYESKLSRLEIQHYSFRNALDLHQNNLDQVFPERIKIKSQIKKLKFDIQTSFIRRGPEFYLDIKDINKEWDFD